MASYRLLAGQHIGADPDWEPSEEEKEIAKTSGRRLRAPSRTYKPGEVVESETNLAEKFGGEKFAEVTGGKGRRGGKEGKGDSGTTEAGDMPMSPALNPAVFPHGQVLQGTQLTDGRSGSTGPDTRESSTVRVPIGTARDNLRTQKQPSSGVEEGGGVKGDGGGGGDGGGTPSFTKAELEEMTVSDLRELAAEGQIELHGATRKDEIVDAIHKGQRKGGR